MRIKTLILSAAIGIGSIAAMSSAASAAVMCNRAGDCWHTDSRYNYHRSWGITVRDNDWRMRRGFHWREHDGRGYWRNGVWMRF